MHEWDYKMRTLISRGTTTVSIGATALRIGEIAAMSFARFVLILFLVLQAGLVSAIDTPAHADWYPSYSGSSDYGADYVGAAEDDLSHAYSWMSGAGTNSYFGWINEFDVCGPWLPTRLCGIATNKCPNGQFVTETGCSTMDRPCNCNTLGNSAPSGIADPINVLTGAVYEEATDFTTQGSDRLSVQRYYSTDVSYAEQVYAAYNAAITPLTSRLGYNWRTQYDRYIGPQSGGLLSSSTTQIEAIRADGTPVHFTNSGSSWYAAYCNPCDTSSLYPQWSSSSDPRHSVDLQLSTDGTYWYIKDQDDTVEAYDNAGKLVSITYRDGYKQTLTYDSSGNNTVVGDSLGRSLTFHYLANGLIDTVTDPTGGVTQYSYVDRSGLGAASGTASLWVLQQVTYPDTNYITYLYGDTNPVNRFALTGIVDENNSGTSNYYVAWTYDPATGRATSNYRCAQWTGSTCTATADQMTISYDDVHNTRTVTNALGKQTIYNLGTYQNYYQISSINDQASTYSPASTVSYTYDSNGYVQTETSGEGREIYYVHNSIGQETSRTEGYGTAQARTIATTWDTSYHVPDEIDEPNLKTNFTYYTGGLLKQLVQTDTTTQTIPYPTAGETRTWNYTYYSSGLLDTVEGPFGSGDTVTYAYNTNGYVNTVQDQLGHTTTITSWNGFGQPLSSTDPNGIVTNYTYDLRDRLKTITRDPTGVNSTTQFTYDNAGQIQVITLPDSSTLTYAYDTAHRLTSVTNNLGQSIDYTLNAMGGRMETDVKSSSGGIAKKQLATFDELNRVLQDIGAISTEVTAHAYDKDNNEVSTTDPRLKVYGHAFDALNRLYQETDPNGHVTTTGYDGQNRPISVTDARSHVTSYVRDGFGDIIQQVSPDTGTTTMYYDALGDMTKKVDARGVETDYTYDTKGRVLTRSISGTSAENVAFTYDTVVSGQSNIDRLTQVSDPSGSTTFSNDALGRVSNEARTIQSQTYNTGFTYDAAGRVLTMTYPSGRIVTYTRNAVGQISAVKTKQTSGSASVTVLSGAAYKAFYGPLSGFTFGNNVVLAQTYDQDYRVTTINAAMGATAIQNLAYTYDAAGNIKTIADAIASARNQTFTYDYVNRVKTAVGLYGSQTYNYDAVGNRTSRVVGSTTDTYATFGTSNRINTITTGSNVRSFTYLPTGQVSGDTRDPSDAYVYTYNQTGRLASAALNGSTVGTYLVNGLEQRVAKTVGSTTTHYIFDRFGHLLCEANGSTGAIQKEYIWLDDLLVAEIDDTGSSPVMYYVHTDHLGRPQKMTDATATVVWDGVFDPFGNVTSVTGSTTNLVMFPGQYYDSETQLSQNWNRDYDPTIGKYIQSDPIGLDGGINLYSYVGQNPLRYIDPQGLLAPWGWPAAAAAEAAGGGPEDPFADLAAAGLLAAATMSDGPSVGGQQPPSNGDNSNCPDDCKRLWKKIQDLMNELQSRYNAMMTDPWDLYNIAYSAPAAGRLASKGTWLGHVLYYGGLQVGLARAIDEAKAKHCPIPPGAEDLAGIPAPSAPGSP